MRETYTTIAGEVLEYEKPEPKLAAFLARVVDAANDPSVTESAMIDLIYGKENPLLRQDLMPHHGVVTREVFADPVYHVMTDLLGRKRVQVGTLNVKRAFAEYTMTVAEAAAQLGVHQSAVRQAIQDHRLDGVKVGGIHLLRPSSVESYHVSRRGPKPKGRSIEITQHERVNASDHGATLHVCVGSEAGRSFRVKVVGGALQTTGKEAQRVSGTVLRFERMAVITGAEGKHRFFELAPADGEDEVSLGPFHVRGPFRVVRKVNNPRSASEEWKKFAAAQR